ncbi:hypothetical protein cypCar_00031536, partial [Cyprinus carpio]
GQEGGYEKPVSDTLTPPQTQPGVCHSFVQEHFQAQYKSSLTCPHCLKQSNTFDPFLCISLPIPLRQTRPVCVTLVFSSKGQRYLRVGLAVPLFGSLACLRRMVADEGKISPDQSVTFDVTNGISPESPITFEWYKTSQWSTKSTLAAICIGAPARKRGINEQRSNCIKLRLGPDTSLAANTELLQELVFVRRDHGSRVSCTLPRSPDAQPL